MIKQLLLPLAGVAAFIVLVGLLVQNDGNISIPGLPTPQAAAQIQRTVSIDDKIIQVEVANTKDAREAGLSQRATLDQNSGMLFVFDDKGVSPEFWMKGMLIPLDIIWVSNGKVVHIDHNAQVPKNGTPDSQLKVYSAPQPVDYVLEVNAGYTATNNILEGDSISVASALQ